MIALANNWLHAIGRRLRQERPQTGWAWTDRQMEYLAWDAYYANTIYESIANGGQRETINASLGNAAAADLGGLYNPVASVVDLYLHVFAGRFSEEIQVVPEGAARPALVEAIERIWQWSNLTIEKQPLCRLAATHGCVGLRIVARDDDDPAKRRVYIKPEHPRIIRDVELDERGNVTAIQLEYDLTFGLAEEAQTITIREEMDKERIATYRMVGASKTPFNLATREADEGAVYGNPLGIVPYVLLRHEHTGDTWGRNAFYKQRGPLDRLNALVSHIDVQIHRHVKAKWFIAASGAAPTEVDLSDLTVAYVDQRQQAAPPIVEPLVAKLDLPGATAQAQMQLALIEDQLPELKATQGKFLAGQSGETIAQLRQPAEDKLSLARTNYEDALMRAQQIAVSWGIMLSLWDVGTGMGDRASADRAYTAGYEDHRFNERPLLPGGPVPATAASASPPPPGAPAPQGE